MFDFLRKIRHTEKCSHAILPDVPEPPLALLLSDMEKSGGGFVKVRVDFTDNICKKCGRVKERRIVKRSVVE